jgi:hypothetical protein
MSNSANKTEAVNAFMVKLDYPLKAVAEAIRETIKGINQTISEEVRANATERDEQEREAGGARPMAALGCEVRGHHGERGKLGEGRMANGRDWHAVQSAR